MKLSIIVALASNRVIGEKNKMPWHLSADLKRFKKITMGSPIIMGRKTHESIGQPLPGRTNIVISRNPEYKQEGCLHFSSVENAIEACQSHEEIFIIGGASIYELTLPKADIIYLTQINKAFDGDTFFPALNTRNWREIERVDIIDDNRVDFTYSFLKLERYNY